VRSRDILLVLLVVSMIVFFGCTAHFEEQDLNISISNSLDTRPSMIHAWSYDSTYSPTNFLALDPENWVEGVYNENNNKSYDFNQIIVESFVDYNLVNYQDARFSAEKASNGEYDSFYPFVMARVFAFLKRLSMEESGFDKDFSMEKCNSYEDEWTKANCYFNRALLTKNRGICQKLPEDFIYYGEFRGSQGHSPGSYSLETRPVVHWNMKQSCEEVINILEINNNIDFDQFCSFALQGTTGYLNEEECEVLS
jgi:hypothetical protein